MFSRPWSSARFMRLFYLILCASILSSTAYAAEFTDLADAADNKDDLIDETFDPFDFHLEPTFQAEFGSAVITREGVCVPDQESLVGEASQNFENSPRLQVDSERCAEPTVIDNREADYKFRELTLNIGLEAGIYKDLQFHLNIPYVLDQSHTYAFASGVDRQNSSINPSDDRVQDDAERSFPDGSNSLSQLDTFSTYRYFDLGAGDSEFKRSGFADPSVGLHWSPFNSERDDTKATLLIGMDYKMPIAPIKRSDNDAVGRGLHELSWKIAASKQFQWIDPYFGLQYFLPLSASDSPITEVDSRNEGQVFKTAPQKGEITVGTEFVPFEDIEEGVRYSIDLRFKFGYTSEGRDYSPLFDAMTNSSCNGKQLSDLLPERNQDGSLNANDVECAWIARQPSNAPLRGGEPNPIYDLSTADSDTEFNFDGITTRESYGTFTGRFGFNLQPSRYFQLRGAVSLTHHQEHFLTNARTGRDGPDSGEESADNTVDLSGPDAGNEKNPVFNPSYDGNGNRFRVQAFNIWTVLLTAAFKF